MEYENRKDTKFRKKLSKQLVFLMILAVFVIGGFTSFALLNFEVTLSGNKDNQISTCSLQMSLKEENPIQLLAAYPITDEAALTYTPYTVTITNSGGSCSNTSYVLSLVSLCDTCSLSNGVCTVDGVSCNCNTGYQIANDMVKYHVTNKTTNAVTTNVNPYSISLSGTLNAGESVSYDLRLWIKSEATNTDLYIYDSNGNILTNTDGSYKTKNFCVKLKLDVQA